MLLQPPTPTTNFPKPATFLRIWQLFHRPRFSDEINSTWWIDPGPRLDGFIRCWRDETNPVVRRHLSEWHRGNWPNTIWNKCHQMSCCPNIFCPLPIQSANFRISPIRWRYWDFFILPPYAMAGNQTHISLVAPPRGTLIRDALATELPWVPPIVQTDISENLDWIDHG